MVSPVVFAIATGIGLLTDKYMLTATNFVEHYAVEMHPTHQQKEFVKSAMYAGAILGMVIFGPLSDIVGRRFGLISCSVITLSGALLSMCAWDVNALIVARIITGIGMGGEYPLASTHCCDSAQDSNDGARNVALLYLFGSGGGPVLCVLVTFLLDLSGIEPELIWRGIFFLGSLLAFVGLVLRYVTVKDAKKFTKAAKRAKGTRRNFLRHYWRPLLGTALSWFLFDIVEYGLKQNDAAIFAASSDAPYRMSVLTVFFTRLLVIPSLAFAPWLLKQMPAKWVQLIGFAGCVVVNFVLALGYHELKEITVLFGALYIVQLSFQSLPGVTTMAIPAEIFPCSVRGTGAAISAAAGKLGATFGAYFFAMMKEQHLIRLIFFVVTLTSAAALLLTMALIPLYNGATLDKAEALAEEGKTRQARQMLYSGPQERDANEALEQPSSSDEDYESTDAEESDL